MAKNNSINHLMIAHLRHSDKEPQSLEDHLFGVSDLSANFAKKIGLKDCGKVLGLLHDLGKASNEFQHYIQTVTGFSDPDRDEFAEAQAQIGKVDHSSAGAQMIYQVLSQKGIEGIIAGQVFSLCIASHHSGLIDCISPDGTNQFQRRINKAEENTHVSESISNLDENVRQIIFKQLDQELLIGEIIEKLKSQKEECESQDTLSFKWGLLIRFLYSCLIDADRLDTANFENPEYLQIRNNNQYQSWQALIQRLDIKLQEFKGKKDKNEVDEIRQQVSDACFDFSAKPRGLYRLAVPTGGGKTLASLRFALNHAAKHQMDHIFYIIPYTSIIDQNADEVRKILEDKDEEGHYLDRVVLEHHSNLTPEEETQRQNLLAENWDAPIIFTTQVQFLEAMFGSGTRNARRMHQLANSVIIFDEVQTIPIRCVHMFNLALRFLVHDCGSTVVLCTATQPLLDQVDPPQRALKIDQQIIPNEKELFRKLKRVEVFDRRKIGGWSDGEIAELVEQELKIQKSVLIVVNTKKNARSLFQVISQKKIADVFHLSTNMCPAHRLDVLKKIREKLDKKQPVICVSTQLIEAGVDIDFGSVIRYLAGLDSIAQAAGRCNRNGKRKIGNIWIINPQQEEISKLVDIHIGAEKAESLLDEYNDHPYLFENDRLGLYAMDRYYQNYFYNRKEEMKYPVGPKSPVGRNDDLFNLLSLNSVSTGEYLRITKSVPTLPFKQSFQTAAKAFHAIDSSTRGVIVPYSEEGQRIINDLCGSPNIEKEYHLIKEAQRYSINLFSNKLQRLMDDHIVFEIQGGTGIFYLNEHYYNNSFGLFDESAHGMNLLICEGESNG